MGELFVHLSVCALSGVLTCSILQERVILDGYLGKKALQSRRQWKLKISTNKNGSLHNFLGLDFIER